MGKFGRMGVHFLQALVMLAVLLIALWFLLNLATKAPQPVGGLAADVGHLASPNQYGL